MTKLHAIVCSHIFIVLASGLSLGLLQIVRADRRTAVHVAKSKKLKLLLNSNLVIFKQSI